MILKLCMWSWVTKRIWLEPLTKFWYPPFTPHYDIFWGELNISSWISTSNLHVQSRRSKATILKFCMGSQLTKRMIATLNKLWYPPFNPHYAIFWGELNNSPESWFPIFTFGFRYQLKIIQCNLAKADPSPGLAKCLILLLRYKYYGEGASLGQRRTS